MHVNWHNFFPAETKWLPLSDILISFDVVSLLTNMPQPEILDLITEKVWQRESLKPQF